MATTTQQEPLDYVRERLLDTPTRDRARIAVDAEVSERTIHNLLNRPDAQYSTVMRLYRVLKKTEAQPGAKASKK